VAVSGEKGVVSFMAVQCGGSEVRWNSSNHTR
jgi:hypothetical protein